MILHIKNMVCPRCIMVVSQIFTELTISYTYIHLGEVQLTKELDQQTKIQLSRKLETVGFALIDDRKSMMIEKIKQLVIEKIHNTTGEDLNIKWPEVVTELLHYDYKYLSSLFSSVEGITLEHYIIKQKIERIKEMIIYDEFTMTQIADQLGYSSIAHLSGQFKKMTGMNPSQFKMTFDRKRKSLDNII